MSYSLNPRNSVNSCHFYVFGVFSMKNFALVMGIPLGFAGAHVHTYPKSGQVARSPHLLHASELIPIAHCQLETELGLAFTM